MTPRNWGDRSLLSEFMLSGLAKAATLLNL